ncbi:MAG: hypothetical protein RLZZ24_1241 [Pseudomonadota bacterium]
MQSNADQPLNNFSNCHVGIVAQLDRLGQLPALLAPAELARKTAEAALAFFPKAVYAHHAEEEQELFPAVRASAHVGEERVHVESLIDRLTFQHRELERMWEQLEPELRKVAKGQSSNLDGRLLTELVDAYQAHAQFEEEAFLPLSQTILGRNSNHMAALGLALHMRHAPYVRAHI